MKFGKWFDEHQDTLIIAITGVWFTFVFVFELIELVKAGMQVR